jgi:hypothetical protein
MFVWHVHIHDQGLSTQKASGAGIYSLNSYHCLVLSAPTQTPQSKLKHCSVIKPVFAFQSFAYTDMVTPHKQDMGTGTKSYGREPLQSATSNTTTRANNQPQGTHAY